MHGKPEESFLVSQITPVDGAAAMPPDGKPLSDVEIELIRQWIAAGAKDDTPPSTKVQYTRENPPVYSLPPVGHITGLRTERRTSGRRRL